MSEGWDQALFDQVLGEEMKHTSRTLAEALNTHAYMIARKALWYTHKADRSKIESDLGRRVATTRTLASGRSIVRRELQLTAADYTSGSLAEAILVARYRKTGNWPASGADFERAIAKFIAGRIRSIAFLKSGWIPAIRILESFTASKSGAAPADRDARIYGQEKGAAYPAVEGTVMVAKILNDALAKGDEGGKALAQYGGAGLELAFYDETAGMKEYVERKLAEQFAKANERL